MLSTSSNQLFSEQELADEETEQKAAKQPV